MIKRFSLNVLFCSACWAVQRERDPYVQTVHDSSVDGQDADRHDEEREERSFNSLLEETFSVCNHCKSETNGQTDKRTEKDIQCMSKLILSQVSVS